jgi:hypothetical protein
VPTLTPNGRQGSAGGGEGSAPAQPDAAGRGSADRTGRAGAGDSQAADGRRNRFAERMQNMSPEEREAALARMRERGIDPTAAGGGFGGRGGGPGANAAGAGAGGRGGAAASRQAGAPRNAPAQKRAPADRDQGATTIDALFAPLPRTESVGRAWMFVDNQLRPLRLRVGISDGQNTELVEGDVKEGTELVTNVTIAGQTTRPATQAFPGFGGPGGRGGFPGGGGRGPGGGR